MANDIYSSSHGYIAYTDSGRGVETLFLMHGLPTAKELWAPVLPLLSPAYRVITFDLNDYGASEKIGRPISHQERADVLDELRAHLRIERFVLVAHDLGASVAIDYMGKHAHRVTRLVLISPPVYPDFREPAIVKLVRLSGLGELLVRWLRPVLFQLGIRRGMVNPTRFTPGLLQAFAGPFAGSNGEAALLRVLRWGRPQVVFAGYPAIIRSITVPTLVLQGTRDPYIPLDQAARLCSDIPGARLRLIEHGGHFLPIDAPDAVADAINAFVADDRSVLYRRRSSHSVA